MPTASQNLLAGAGQVNGRQPRTDRAYPSTKMPSSNLAIGSKPEIQDGAAPRAPTSSSFSSRSASAAANSTRRHGSHPSVSQPRIKDSITNEQSRKASLSQTATRGQPRGRMIHRADYRDRSRSPIFAPKSPDPYRRRSPRPPTSPVPRRPDRQLWTVSRGSTSYVPPRQPVVSQPSKSHHSPYVIQAKIVQSGTADKAVQQNANQKRAPKGNVAQEKVVQDKLLLSEATRAGKRQSPLHRQVDQYEPARSPRYARETRSSMQKRRSIDTAPHSINQVTPPGNQPTQKALADCNPRELRDRLRGHGLTWAYNEKQYLIEMLQECEKEYEAGYAEIMKYLGNHIEADEFGRRAAQIFNKERVEADRLKLKTEKFRAKETATTAKESHKEEEDTGEEYTPDCPQLVKAPFKRKRSQNSHSGDSSFQQKTSEGGTSSQQQVHNTKAPAHRPASEVKTTARATKKVPQVTPNKRLSPPPRWWGESSDADESDRDIEMSGTKAQVPRDRPTSTNPRTAPQQKRQQQNGEDTKGVAIVKKGVAVKRDAYVSSSEESSAEEDDWLVEDEREHKAKRRGVAKKSVAGMVKDI